MYILQSSKIYIHSSIFVFKLFKSIISGLAVDLAGFSNISFQLDQCQLWQALKRE